VDVKKKRKGKKEKRRKKDTVKVLFVFFL